MTKDFTLVQRLTFIREMCSGKSVLHLGCTNYPYTREAIDSDLLLHFELEKITSELYGFDADQPGIDILTTHGSRNIYRADAEHLEDVEIDRKFDVIVAGEMIEHLNNPGLFLEGIKRFMSPGSKLLITTINAYSGMRFVIYGLRGYKGKLEPVHPDHVAYYSYSTLKLMIERHGLQLDQFLFYDIGTEHRPHNGWKRNMINDLFVFVAPQWSDGIIAVCTLPETDPSSV